MADREDIGIPAEETASLLDGPPRDEDVAEDITKNAKRAWLIGAGALLIVSLSAWGVFAVMDGGGADDVGNGGEADSTADATKDASEVSTSSNGEPDDEQGLDSDPDDDDSEVTTDDDDSAMDADDDTSDISESWVDAGMVAFRMGDELWVANEDGTDARYVADCDGEYLLSPDGTALVAVGPAGTLRLIQVDTGSWIQFDQGFLHDVAWHPGSSFVVYALERAGLIGSEVLRYGCDGTVPLVLGSGSMGVAAPAVSPDGSQIVFFTRSDSADDLEFWVVPSSMGLTRSLTVEEDFTDLVWGPDGFYYTTFLPAGVPSIRKGTLDDPDGDEFIGPPQSPGFMVGYGSITLSPDGRWLAYTTFGDDGYSRLFVVDTTGGTSRELSIRYDAYPLRWSSDGEYLLFIEGNAFQGEGTRLMRVRPDGMGRQTLIEGAGL